MYNKVYERLLRYIQPFHQKVLHFNYDLPLEQLTTVLDTVLQVLHQHYPLERLYSAEDRLEYDGRATGTCQEWTLHSIRAVLCDEERLYRFGNTYSWMKMGIFDDGLEWYLRVFIEDDDNLSAQEPRSGNIEIYLSDHILYKMAELIPNQVAGHMLVEGAKRYIEEIYI